MTIEEAEARIEVLEEKLEALGDAVTTILGIVEDNLKHRSISEAQRDLNEYNRIKLIG